MKKNTFIEGTIVAYIAILLTKIIGAIYVIPFYKIVGESGGVLYSYAYNVYNLFLNISTSGIPTAVSIVVAEYNALKLFNEREYTYKIATKLIAVISFIAFIMMFVFAKYIGLFLIGNIEGGHSIESIELVIRVISFCLLVIPFLSITRGYLQGNKYVSVSSLSQPIEQFVRIFIVLVGSYVAINLLNFNVTVGVSVALSGTVLGGLAALLYLKNKIKKNKNELLKDVNNDKLTVKGIDIIKKLAICAIPVIIISVTQNIYELIDFKFILMGLYKIEYDAKTCEFLASIIVTWAPKICMIINALAIGLCTSIIPFIVSNYVENNKSELNNKFNQAINIINYVGIPLALFITVFSREIYYIFYGYNDYGSVVLKALAFVSILFSIHLVINMILQGMKKYKIVYINTIAGIIVNAVLDIPLILLLNKIGFYPYIGTLVSTMIGQSVSILIVLVTLKKELSFKYMDILTTLGKVIISSLGAFVLMVILKNILFNTGGYIKTLILLGVSGILTMGLYAIITYKTKIMFNIIDENVAGKILRKLKIQK